MSCFDVNHVKAQAAFFRPSSLIPHPCFSVSAAARRFDSDPVASFKLPASFGTYTTRMALTDDNIPSLSSIFSAVQAIRRSSPAVCEQRHARGHERLYLAHNTIAAPVPALSP